jgi:hypothetical protein
MDYGKYEINEKAKAAMQKCPTGVIVFRGKSAVNEKRSGD